MRLKDQLDELYSKKELIGLVLWSWGYIEAFTDTAVRLEYGLDSEDSKLKFLLRRNVDEKLRFLKDMGFFEEGEYAKITKFKDEDRNKIFHRFDSVWVDLVVIPERSQEVMDRAREAGLTMESAFLRRTNVWSKKWQKPLDHSSD